MTRLQMLLIKAKTITVEMDDKLSFGRGTSKRKLKTVLCMSLLVEESTTIAPVGSILAVSTNALGILLRHQVQHLPYLRQARKTDILHPILRVSPSPSQGLQHLCA